MQQIADQVGKWLIIAVLLVLLVQLVRAGFGMTVAPVPAGVDSWSKWVGAMVALGLAIRGLAKGFRSLL